ncbi:MAG: AbrB/MazE/SpoVT family DNA-binding domain-containing protein [Gemmatimonadaceae bacterium]
MDLAALPEEVELHAEPGRIVIEAAERPRAGWEEAARRMASQGDDALLDRSTATHFDDEEWEWH